MSGFEDMSTKLVVKGKAFGLKCFKGPPSVTPSEPFPSDPLLDTSLTIDDVKIQLGPIFSPDGSKMAYTLSPIDGVSNNNIIIKDSETGSICGEIPAASEVQDMHFSPLGTFVVTFNRAVKGTDGVSLPNLCVWRLTLSGLATLEIAYHQKKEIKDILQWSNDESICTRINSNEVNIMKGNDLPGGSLAKVYHKGIISFKLGSFRKKSSGLAEADADGVKQTSIAVFNPEVGSSPARITVYPVTISPSSPSLSSSSSSSSSILVVVEKESSSKSIFAASEAKMLFAPSGETLLVYTQSDIDRTGTSYMGSTGLLVLSCFDASLSEIVEQSKAGPVYDVQWSPTDDIFVVAAGTMPNHCTLYNSRAERQFEFGAAHRNTISWSPHGRFLCLAGFGNLAGDMDFFDIHRKKKFGSACSHCAVSFGWSPDSRYFMTATLAPRMNVDNGFKIFKYNGAGPVMSLKFDGLATNCLWRPAATGAYENRPPSPGSRRVTATADEASIKPKTEAYRPPGARASGSLVADLMKRETVPAGKVLKSKPTTAARIPDPPKRIPVGMSAPAASSSSSSNTKTKKPKSKPAPVVVTPIPIEPPAVVEEVAIDPEKKAKNLRKRLKQIAELKEKKLESGGAELNDDQLLKIATEEQLRIELQALGFKE